MKPKPGTKNVSEDHEMKSGSEFSLIAGGSDLTDVGDLAEHGKLTKQARPVATDSSISSMKSIL